ncbi:type I-E CRISPR-associated protein Cse1/CasA [Rothia nasisuis]|uniref:type I-E CRISPR-associated protein Cse1/CasA n=1 Tax=Rothia nasisuis TaxID=2109647 RepID=UPI0023515790|nr:type I-E CRISPR-associated protein Cse1/CasA [Rothia nasisuis]
MLSNALTDIPWIRLEGDEGVSNITIRDALLSSHQEGTALDKKIPGYLLGAQTRILRDVLAVVLRYEEGYEPRRERTLVKRIFEQGLSESAVDRGIKQLEAGADVFSSSFPFLQCPVLEPESSRDTSRIIEPGNKPVKKLHPNVIPGAAEDFWNLSSKQKSSFGIVEAVQSLAVHYHYSMAGNNVYAGRKCSNGTPGARAVESGQTATEIFWEEKSLLATLLQSLPKTWVQGHALPAWCDRTGATALLDDGTEHPLWAGTWSSNTAACLWDDDRLVGVRIGGIPDEWYLPTMGQDKDARKNWWDQRDINDPFYLYMKNQMGEYKDQRLDLGRDATDLAVEWAAEEKGLAAQDRRDDCFYSSRESRLSFIRHQIQGSSTTSIIRASQVYIPNPELWSFGQPQGVQLLIQRQAHVLQKIHSIVCSPFRRWSSEERKKDLKNRRPDILDNLANLRVDVSTNYWRFITPVYKNFLQHDSEVGGSLPDSLLREAIDAAIEAYDVTVLPYRNQDAARIEYVRGHLSRRIRKAMNIINETPNQEEADGE